MPMLSDTKDVVKYISVRHVVGDEEMAKMIYAQQAMDLGLHP